ncbi:MAG: hypothetical protein HUK20_14965 [Fibrobacter sp.]|nr:hypothetical protein [Fibrobacter sp.]
MKFNELRQNPPGQGAQMAQKWEPPPTNPAGGERKPAKIEHRPRLQTGVLHAKRLFLTLAAPAVPFSFLACF